MTEFRWSPYDPVTDLVRFTQGDCHILARAIHRRTGWTFCTFDWKGAPDAHAFVQRPDGQFVDIQGVTDEAMMLRRWDCKKITHWNDFERFVADYPSWGGGWCTFGLYSYLRADQLSRKIAAW